MANQPKYHRTINGEPYIFSQLRGGNWRVTANSQPTDHFHRSYTVNVLHGRPASCSCPHCYERHAWCKHLRELEALLAELQPAEQQTTSESAKASQPATRPFTLTKSVILTWANTDLSETDTLELPAGAVVDYHQRRDGQYTWHHISYTVDGREYTAARATYQPVTTPEADPRAAPLLDS